jgi:hypothetical protein
MEKDNMDFEKAPNSSRTHIYPKKVPHREPLPEMRFQYGGMSVAEIQEKNWRTPEEILGIPLPKPEAPPQKERPTYPPAHGDSVLRRTHL